MDEAVKAWVIEPETGLDEELKDFVTSPPCGPEDVAAAEAALGIVLPEDYKAFLRLHDGASGWIGNTRLQLWRAGELATLNQAGSAVLAFGDDGRASALAFDLRRKPFPVVILPIASLDLDAAEPMAKSFAGLFYRMTRPGGSLFAREFGT
jgi:hypothetical protein